MNDLKLRVITLVIAGGLAGAVQADDFFRSTVLGNTYIGNGSQQSIYIDLSSAFTTTPGQVTTITSPIQLDFNFHDSGGFYGGPSDGAGATTAYSQLSGPIWGFPYVYDGSTFLREENRGNSGGQTMFVDIFKRDFIREQHPVLESASVKVLLPNGQSTSTFVSSDHETYVGRYQNSGAIITTTWYTPYTQHYSCAVLNAHYCSDSIHDYYTQNQEFYWTDTYGQSAMDMISMQIDPSSLGSATGVWIDLRSVSGDSAVSVDASFFTNTAAVPEPEVWGLMLVGLALVTWRKKKSSRNSGKAIPLTNSFRMPNLLNFKNRTLPMALVLLSAFTQGCTTMQNLKDAGSQISQGNILTGLYLGTVGTIATATYDAVTLGGTVSAEEGTNALVQVAQTQHQAEQAKKQAATNATRVATASGYSNFSAGYPNSSISNASQDSAVRGSQVAYNEQVQSQQQERINLSGYAECISVKQIKSFTSDNSIGYALRNDCAFPLKVSWCDKKGCTRSSQSADMQSGQKEESWALRNSYGGVRVWACQLRNGSNNVYFDSSTGQCWSYIAR